MSNVFDHLKRQSFQFKSPRAYEEIFFQLCFSEYGTFLQTVGPKGKPVETSYLNYSGAVRNALRALEQIREKNGFVINWERSSDQIYLAEHPFLLEALRPCDNVVDERMNPLSFSAEPAELLLSLSPSERKNHLDARLELHQDNQPVGDFNLISEQFALCGQHIVEMPPLGANFASLHLFNTELDRRNLTLFLSLAFSYADHLGLAFQDYRLVFAAEKIKAAPCLIFEKMDGNKALFLRVGQTLPDLDFSALEQYDLYRHAEVNELARSVTLRFIDQAPSDQLTGQILRLLRRHEPKKSKSDREDILLDGNLLIVPEETAAAFIYNDLPNLLGEYAVFGAEKLKSYKINAKPPKLEFNLSHNIDFFEGDINLDFEGEKINLFDALAQYGKNRYVQLSYGSHALLNEAYVKRLEHLFLSGLL
jgi:hypothetical protein